MLYYLSFFCSPARSWPHFWSPALVPLPFFRLIWSRETWAQDGGWMSSDYIVIVSHLSLSLALHISDAWCKIWRPISGGPSWQGSSDAGSDLKQRDTKSQTLLIVFTCILPFAQNVVWPETTVEANHLAFSEFYFRRWYGCAFDGSNDGSNL